MPFILFDAVPWGVALLVVLYYGDCCRCDIDFVPDAPHGYRRLCVTDRDEDGHFHGYMVLSGLRYREDTSMF